MTFSDLVEQAKKKIKEVTVAQTHQKMKDGEEFFLVDTREDSEWAQGRIVGSVHIGKGVIERDIQAKIPDKDSQIVLYCGGGNRSALAALPLLEMGYTQVFSMAGGIRAWKQEDLPLES